MKLQSFLFNMVYWMFGFKLLKYSKTATEKVAFFSVADCTLYNFVVDLVDVESLVEYM